MQIELMAANNTIRNWMNKPSSKDRHLDKLGGVIASLRLVKKSNPSMYAIYRPQLTTCEIEIVEFAEEGVRMPPVFHSLASTDCPVCGQTGHEVGCHHLLAVLDISSGKVLGGSAAAILEDLGGNHSVDSKKGFGHIVSACKESADYSKAVSLDGKEIWYNSGQRWFWSKDPSAAQIRMKGGPCA